MFTCQTTPYTHYVKTVRIKYPYPEFDCPDDIVRLHLPYSVTPLALHTAIQTISAQLREDPDVNDSPLDFVDTLLYALRDRFPTSSYEWVSGTDILDIGDLMGR